MEVLDRGVVGQAQHLATANARKATGARKGRKRKVRMPRNRSVRFRDRGLGVASVPSRSWL
jgi:hypothetical protein